MNNLGSETGIEDEVTKCCGTDKTFRDKWGTKRCGKCGHLAIMIRRDEYKGKKHEH